MNKESAIKFCVRLEKNFAETLFQKPPWGTGEMDLVFNDSEGFGNEAPSRTTTHTWWKHFTDRREAEVESEDNAPS